MLHKASDLDILERPRQQKMDVRFGTWNVRTGSLKTVAGESGKL
jgi:hypothetical protein